MSNAQQKAKQSADAAWDAVKKIGVLEYLFIVFTLSFGHISLWKGNFSDDLPTNPVSKGEPAGKMGREHLPGHIVIGRGWWLYAERGQI